MMLLASGDVGLWIGFATDVGATQQLARALTYAADPDRRVDPALQASPAPLAPLDNTALVHQFGDNSGYIEAVPAPGPSLGSTAPGNPSVVLTVASAKPAPPAGGGASTGAPTPAPVATVVPVVPGPSASPGKSGHVNGRVLDSRTNKPVDGATVNVFQSGNLIGSATSPNGGHFMVGGLAPATSYTYSASAPGHVTSTGAFTTDSMGQATITIAL